MFVDDDLLLVDDPSTLRDGRCTSCFTWGKVLTRRLLGIAFTACEDSSACLRRRMAEWKKDEEECRRLREKRLGLEHLRSVRAALETEEGRKLAAEIVEEVSHAKMLREVEQIMKKDR